MEVGNKHYTFLQGGGELGVLTRNFDWSATPVGTVDQWPLSLSTTVGIILHSGFPMFLWWGDDMVQFYNDAYRPSLGETGKHPKALGQTARECWPEIWDIIYPLIYQVKTTGESFFLEDQLVPIYRNGALEDVYWTFSYSAVHDEQGSIGGVLVVCHETTKKVEIIKRLENTQSALLLSESNLRNMIEQAPVAMCILKGPNHVVEIANDRMYALWGKSRAQMINKPVFDELIDAGKEGFAELLNHVYHTGFTYTAYGAPVTLYRNNTKELAYIQFVYEAFREGNGEITGVMVVAIDVTREVEARQQLQESEHKIRSLVESAPFPIGVYEGVEMRISILNQAIIDVWGKGSDNLIGKTYMEVLPELEVQEIYSQLTDVFKTGNPFHARNERVDLVVNGTLETFFFNYSFTPLYDGNGNIYGVMNTAADVTDLVLAQQRIEEIVKQRTESLERKNAELSQFAYIASHDLQEPARKISTFIESLERSLPKDIDHKSKNYIKKIERASSRMLSLIRDVLAISRLSRDKDNFEAVDLNSILAEVLADYELLIEEKQCKVELNNELPTIEAIPVQMSQLISNLVSNALKFARKDTPLLIKIVHSRLDADSITHFHLSRGTVYCKIAFSDNGIGFDQQYAAQIFNIFQRLHGRSEYEGTGIGLAICKKIVENHGGQIFAMSTLNAGATFTVILPIRQ